MRILSVAIAGALRLDRGVCATAATSQFLVGLEPIPLPVRERLAVRRSSAMIARMAARRQTSEAGDAN